MDEDEEFQEENLDAQLSEALSQKKKLEDLSENENFKVFKKLIEAQIEMRTHQAFIMPNGLDDVVKRIYSSGEIAGMKVAINLPQVIVDGLSGSVKFIKAQMEQQKKQEGNK